MQQHGFCPTCKYNDSYGCLINALAEYRDSYGKWKPGQDIECREWKAMLVKVESICSWCGKLMAVNGWEWYEGIQPQSYGICPECAKEIRRELECGIS